MPTPNGLLQSLKAMPHSAIAHEGSAWSVAVKAVDRAAELERMQQRHGAIELRLRRRAAGGRERDRSELLGGRAAVFVVLRHGGGGEGKNDGHHQSGHSGHSPFIRPNQLRRQLRLSSMHHATMQRWTIRAGSCR